MRPAQALSAPRVLAADPGAVDTGLCIRQGDTVLAHAVVHRHADETGHHGVGVGPRYLRAVHARVDELLATVEVDLVALEGVKRPNPHVAKGRRTGNHVIDPTHTIAAAIILGSLWHRFPDAVVVPPGGNGSGLLAGYPDELVTPGEARHGLNRAAPQSSTMRHVRSAYDVAGAGVLMARLRASTPAR